MSALTYTQCIDYRLSSEVEAKLATLRTQAEAISGEWNGDESGTLEDRAEAATELIEHINAITELLEEL